MVLVFLSNFVFVIVNNKLASIIVIISRYFSSLISVTIERHGLIKTEKSYTSLTASLIYN